MEEEGEWVQGRGEEGTLLIGRERESTTTLVILIASHHKRRTAHSRTTHGLREKSDEDAAKLNDSNSERHLSARILLLVSTCASEIKKEGKLC